MITTLRWSPTRLRSSSFKNEKRNSLSVLRLRQCAAQILFSRCVCMGCFVAGIADRISFAEIFLLRLLERIPSRQNETCRSVTVFFQNFPGVFFVFRAYLQFDAGHRRKKRLDVHRMLVTHEAENAVALEQRPRNRAFMRIRKRGDGNESGQVDLRFTIYNVRFERETPQEDDCHTSLLHSKSKNNRTS